VRDCVEAMVDVVSIPVTVKHRIGIDKTESYGFVRDFVGTVAEGGCKVFIVHARNAWLKGLSPKENREVPPLRYEFVYRLKRDFPALTIVLNGGVKTDADIAGHLQYIDGVMVGREAYQHPWAMSSWDSLFWHQVMPEASRENVWERYRAYVKKHMLETPGRMPHEHSFFRHAIGLRNGLPGARKWRQDLSQRKHEVTASVSTSSLTHLVN
jgi:tRNA-dihydrouridine synthase A